MDGSFEQAVAFVASSTAASSNETKLKLYALFKIAIVSSRPTTSRPGLLDWTGRAKWDAWDKLGREERFQGEAGKQRAQEEYVEEARRLGFNAGERAGEGETQNVPKKEKQEQMVSVSTMGTDFVDEAPPSRLHELAISGDANALEAFLRDKAARDSVNERDSYGYTALHLAVDRGNSGAVRALLDAGADRSIQDEDGNTALDLARLAEHEDLVTLLT
ncbi:Ankyrin repeat-containing domain protein [Rhodotorula toruloides]|uniref:Ankyrin repeat-containing domain protein n=1 Tax=Rhodotorula toruloides TaxID=5286 RepID=A0A0K3CC95_RHOTO|nr:Ankyrin repeat-containing domain protein [Rhodotorula toruloides]PRQ76354.1 Ankyrin repeat-containing domain protein [Rhodotorula toruloides]